MIEDFCDNISHMWYRYIFVAAGSSSVAVRRWWWRLVGRLGRVTPTPCAWSPCPSTVHSTYRRRRPALCRCLPPAWRCSSRSTHTGLTPSPTTSPGSPSDSSDGRRRDKRPAGPTLCQPTFVMGRS